MEIRSLSQLLLEFDANLKQETLSLEELLKTFHERGFGVLLFLFALPAALPLPAIGINAIIALPLIFLTTQQALGRHTIWFPKSWLSKTIRSKDIKNFQSKALPFITKIEILSRPRLGFITQGIFSNLIGILGLFMALYVVIPLPLTNTVPSFGIALMAIGVIMRDGLAVIAGAIIGILWMSLLTYFLIVFGTEGLDFMKDMIKSLLE